MADTQDKQQSAMEVAADALGNQGKDRPEKLLKAADELRKEMERQSLQVRDLILALPPVQLLGYLWAQFHMGVMADIRERGDEYRPNKDLIQRFQFALEYAHAVWSCHAQLIDEKAALDEAKATALFKVLEELKNTTTMYCMASSAANIDADGSRGSANTEFHAKSAWVLIRGHRYQVLEEEFIRFVLEPHADALRAAYEMDHVEIATGIQAIANTMRTGFSEAMQTVYKGMKKTHDQVDETMDGIEATIEKLKQTDNSFAVEISGAIRDIFYGGICSLSRHTKLTPPLLDDLSYLPGGNTEFFADGDFKGTPMRTLPALVKPGIKLGDEYYAADGQFVRDASYRAIQRGLLSRLPAYREEWNRRQKTLIEYSYPTIFNNQLADAAKFPEVYFKDPQTGQWVETDLIMTLGDVLLVIEAKAGVMAMHSPATNFDRHERAIRDLVVKAYEQCKRFMQYLSSAPEVMLYKQVAGEFMEVARLRRRNFRTILPIGITVEAFTPFSALSKELAGIAPLLGRHPFISMSVDDLFVLNRFLPTTGELFHYLEVRQQVAGIPNAMLIDEIEHLGAYIADNRFDLHIKHQLMEADLVAWDSFGDVVDEYFEGDVWKTEPPPHQEYPDEIVTVLSALDEYRPLGWLEMDSHIRSLSGRARSDLAGFLTEVRATLPEIPIRRFLLGEEMPLQVWVCRDDFRPSTEEMRYQGEVACLVANAPRVVVLRVSYNENNAIIGVGCGSYLAPLIVQANYPELQDEAKRQRARFVKVDKRSQRKRRR